MKNNVMTSKGSLSNENEKCEAMITHGRKKKVHQSESHD